MYISVRFPNSDKSYIYSVQEDLWPNIDLFDDVLVNAREELHLVQVVDLNVDEPTYKCRDISYHFSKEDTEFFLEIGRLNENP